MKIRVTQNTVEIIEEDIINKGEFNVHKCIFEFSEEYENLTKRAYFDGNEVPIKNDECYIHEKALEKSHYASLGVSAFEMIDKKETIRYSPEPTRFYIRDGSYTKRLDELTDKDINAFDYCMATIDKKEKEIQELIDDLNEKVESGFFKGKPGEDGPPGQNGIDGKDGTNGIDGKDGVDGENGATFIPSVDEEGNLSWSNDKGLDNPSTVNIKGADGKNGEQGIQGDKGDPFTYEDFTEAQLESLRGPQGLQGVPGKDGIDGKNGVNGKDGSDGKSAYQSWLDLGNTGTEQDFIDSLRGSQGEKGQDGVNGTNGQDGYTPVKYRDYWNEEDITSIKDYCTNYIDENITQVLGGSY